MGTGVEVIGTGSDKIVATSSNEDWVFSDSWDRAVDERNIEDVIYISHINYRQEDKLKQMGAQRCHIRTNQSFDIIHTSTSLHM